MDYNARHWQARGSLGDAIFKLSQEDPRDNAGKIRRLQDLYGELAKAKEIAMRRDEYNWGEDEDYEAKLDTIKKETRPYIDDDDDDDSSSSFSPGPSLRVSDLRRSPSSSSSSSSYRPSGQARRELNIINQNDFWKKILIEKGKIKSFENQKFLIEKKEVKLMRLSRCLENIQMLNTLVKSHKVEQLKNFQKLQELERLTLDQL